MVWNLNENEDALLKKQTWGWMVLFQNQWTHVARVRRKMHLQTKAEMKKAHGLVVIGPARHLSTMTSLGLS